MALDPSDIVNAVIEQVILTLQGFADQDSDWENPRFVKGFPQIQPSDPLPRPVIAVYCYNSESWNTGYDDIVATNDLQPSNPLYMEFRGVEIPIDLYVDVYVEKGTVGNPVKTGGLTVASRIAGKILTRLRLHSECLGGELDLERVRMEGPYEPADSRDAMHVFYRLDVGLTATVSD